MMRRSLIVIPSAILVLIAALAAVTWFSLRHNITPAAADEIKLGMTRAEVESLLGGPPGRYNRWRRVMFLVPWSTAGMMPGDNTWIADDFAVIIRYDRA